MGSWLTAMCAAVFAASICGTSELPSTAAGNARSQGQFEKSAAQGTESSAHGTERSPLFVKIVPPAAEQVPTKAAADHGDWHSNPEWWVAFLTGVLALVTAGLVWYTAHLWGATKNLVADAKDNARIIERAYVKMSHRPPGIEFGPVGSGTFGLAATIMNHGSTPATVTDVVVTPIFFPLGEPLPADPPYQPSTIATEAFLVKGDQFFHMVRGTAPVVRVEGTKNGSQNLYVVGYVDYRDMFGGRWRSGYARLYSVEADQRDSYAGDRAFGARSNLGFVSQAGYNYDRQRVPGEGKDWTA